MASFYAVFGSYPVKAEGITTPLKLPAFDSKAATCKPPVGLDRSLVFLQDNDRQFMEGVKFGLAQAAERRGLKFTDELAEDASSKMVAAADAAVANNAGALVAAPIDALALAPSLLAAIAKGTYVGTVVPPPAVTILNAPQYLTGERLAQAASEFIIEKLDGRANVVLLTHDSLQFLAPRFKAMRDVLGRLPDVRIVADISPALSTSREGTR
ncbi:substrate-binding domain-containing protein (plasmid) [Rhizobium sp. 32-5/1]|uniref:substrate-binding domain-containing protein n=1 Tax=Rhizobium sp. 32-5/1 TaxID=3019602 RepID=UPI00240D6AE8|nr:substrate-binding domain-containing protein [Rhizobium sp. 32-5/1]WEZ85548.1 substrate-binding domain-containing protein [Rhizobium sp. 32-5/1]